MLLIYTAAYSPRINYIVEVTFSSVLSCDFRITTNKEEFLNYAGPRLNHSGIQVSANEIWIQPHSLLFETNIQPQVVTCFEWAGLIAFFKTGGDIPFDIFAASFYLVSRYEEYLPHTKDEYGRYAHTNSLACKQNFLHLPLVNMWIQQLLKVIGDKFPLFTFRPLVFTFLPTYDIDIAYAYKGKNLLRNAGGFCKEVFTAKWTNLAERASVIAGRKKDPFDTYDWLNTLHDQYKLQPYYFFLLAAHNKLYDKNISPARSEMNELVTRHANQYTVGIHPSWQSGDDEKTLKQEISTLKTITCNPVTVSRQHYIRMKLPRTYRLLIENGIAEDHSMGYGSINGFRASITSPYYWYDLEKEVKTNLLLRPFCYMEANSYFEQHYTAEQAAKELQQYHDIVKVVNGQLITIFHNHFITEQPQWLAWRKMYAAFLQNNFSA